MKKFSFFFFLILQSLVLQSLLFSHPTKPQIVSGEMKSVLLNEKLKIDAKNKTIINWENFSIDKNEVLKICLPNEKASILNRVVGDARSDILGKLSSNGKVFLVNPKGVLIGKDGVVDCHSFVATTMNISDKNFKEKKEFLFFTNTKAEIENLGVIKAKYGDVYLLAHRIKNKGEIVASNGQVRFATGKQILLKPDNEESVFIIKEFDEDDSQITNEGFIEAVKTQIEATSKNVYELAIKHSGTIQTPKVINKNGEIYLVARKGNIDVSGKIIARNESSKGGKIHLLGKSVKLEKTSIDASGKSGGGEVLIGGDYKGQNPAIINADRTTIDSGSTICANAIEEGDGGKVIVWGNKHTSFGGKIFAKGGEKSGDGGFVEISVLDANQNQKLCLFYGSVDLSNRGTGEKGTLLFDPKNIIINSSGEDPATGQTFASDPSSDVSISGSSLASALSSANVTLQANNDITVNDTVTSGSSNNLTLQAGRSITLNVDSLITLTGGAFSATINDENALSDYRDAGIAQFIMQSAEEEGTSASIVTNNGNVTIQKGSFGGSTVGEVRHYGTINAGTGNVSITGKGRNNTSQGQGVTIYDGTVIGNQIQITGVGGNGEFNNYGVFVSGENAVIRSDTGSITITGSGGSDTSSNNAGIMITGGSSLITNGSATMSLTGTGAAGDTNQYGIMISKSSLQTVDGNITINGTGGVGAENNQIGFYLDDSQILSTGTGVISIEGTGGSGINNSCGIIFSGATAEISSTSSNIFVTGYGGTATKSNTTGFLFTAGSKITTSNSGTITLSGYGGSGPGSNYGMSFSGSSQITTSDGDISLLLEGGSDPSGRNEGFSIFGGSIIQSTSLGDIDINASGGAGTNAMGLEINGVNSAVICKNGNITISATKGPQDTGEDYSFEEANPVRSDGTGTVTINGEIINP